MDDKRIEPEQELTRPFFGGGGVTSCNNVAYVSFRGSELLDQQHNQSVIIRCTTRAHLMQASPPPKRVRFGVFEADFSAGDLRKRGRRVTLQEQPFKVLALLLRQPGEVVTREELR